MKKLSSTLLIAVGLLNLYPLIGVSSADQLASLYGISINSVDLEILMRHRAVMLGLIGGFLLLAAFRPSLQAPAASIGLVSMSSFVILAYFSEDIGPEIYKVAVADIIGSIATAIILIIVVRERRNAA